MAKEWSPWRDGRRAWERLQGWLPGGSAQPPATPDEGALNALSDVGLLRRLLDQAELSAVRAARRQRRSWAEIATRLGVTRQSAWERWRDLDENEPTGTDAVEQVRAAAAAAAASAATPVPGRRPAAEEVPLEVRERAAWERRRRSNVVVPNVVGLSFDEARSTLLERGLLPVGPDPDGPPLTALGWPDGVVTDQSPEAGAKVPSGSRVTLWMERGGGTGVREPRQPRPTSGVGRAMRAEPGDQAAG